MISGVGFPSGKRTIPALVQCLQRFRAPKVGCASSSLNSSEHCMGLFAAPGAEEAEIQEIWSQEEKRAWF